VFHLDALHQEATSVEIFGKQEVKLNYLIPAPNGNPLIAVAEFQM
jgi:hypothetical protein